MTLHSPVHFYIADNSSFTAGLIAVVLENKDPCPCNLLSLLSQTCFFLVLVFSLTLTVVCLCTLDSND